MSRPWHLKQHAHGVRAVSHAQGDELSRSTSPVHAQHKQVDAQQARPVGIRRQKADLTQLLDSQAPEKRERAAQIWGGVQY
jgi:hypothetical protein